MSSLETAAPRTEILVVPTMIGTAFAGGFYAGRIGVGADQYALIVAPAAGDIVGRWHQGRANVEGAVSLCDGLANTQAMAAAGSTLAEAALALTIDGLSDWYLPARDELELLYRHFKPSDYENYACDDGANDNSIPPGEEYTEESPAQTTVAALRDGAPDAMRSSWYWSSTQHASIPSHAWNQDFDDGYQYYSHKSYEGRARAVRRLKI